MSATCHVCGHQGLAECEGFARLARVTSDCRPWPAGGRLGVCPRCATAQKVVDAAFEKQCAEIYRGYALYFQGQGGEQRVFDQDAGTSRPRSQVVLDWLLERVPDLGPAARILDAGCGRGDFLARLRTVRPQASLHGLEHNPAYREPIEALGARFYESFEDAGGIEPFDLITLLHALEHIPEPAGFLARAAGLLNSGGTVFVDVPNFLDNPFDLVIADHCTHFCADTLALVLKRAGFSPLAVDGERLPKEWLALAGPSPGQKFGLAWPHPDLARQAQARVGAALVWLAAMAAKAEALAGSGLGIFGTAIAGVWLFEMLGGRAEFFVDEDPGRTGEFMGRPVLAPGDVPAGKTVFIPMPHATASRIAARLGGLGPVFIGPDA